MNHSRSRTNAWTLVAVLVCLLLPAAAAAQMTVPVTLRITELVQLNHGQDPGVGGIGQSLGDFYAEVSINGTTLTNVADKCDNPPATPPANMVFDVPYVFFAEDDPLVDPSCPNVPEAWTFTVDVPLTTLLGNFQGIPIVIRIKDSDSGPFNDDDTPATINLKVPFGGRWSGDVKWPENCNREAVEGSGARICWQIEVGKDSDGDGLLDDWEINGIDMDGDGVIDVNLPAMGANPMHKDLFVELDWVPGFEPQRAAIQQWKEAFALAPIDAGGVLNPDGLPGITLHVDTGSLTENGLLVGDNLGGGNALPAGAAICGPDDLAPAKAANFNPIRRLAFRYGITARSCCQSGPSEGISCQEDAQCGVGHQCSPGGFAENFGANDFLSWSVAFQASTLMHELGHLLGLTHGGSLDEPSANCKPNYMSIMNYNYYEIDSLVGPPIIDYSPARKSDGSRGLAPLPPLDEAHLDETAVLDPSNAEHLIVFVNALDQDRLSPVNAPVNWNGDGDATDTDTSVGALNTDGADKYPSICKDKDGLDKHTGFHDWSVISMPFIQFGFSANAPVPPSDPEPRDDEILRQRKALNTADLSIGTTGNPGPYEAGSEVVLSYSHTARNLGPNPALPPRVRDTLPPGAVVLASNPACTEDPAGQLTCPLPSLLPGQEAGMQLSVRTRAGCVGGVPTPIVNRAVVENAALRAGPDPQPANNVATFQTAVVDTTPPQLTLSASPSVIWPPNHQFVPITITVTTSDVCDTNPAIRLVSITSNEAADAPGSGRTSPDVQGAAVNTDDRQFQLRAERSGQGDGRIYTITYEAKDGSGNVTTSTVTVTVPKSQSSP